MATTVGLRTHEGIYLTLSLPPVPPCTLDTSRKDSVSWSLCRGPNATVAFLPKSPFVVENWGANWKVLAKHGIIIVPAQPLYLYTSMWWEGPGTGAPVILVSPDHTSPWHYNSWKMGLPFIARKHLYEKFECNLKNVLGCFYQDSPPKQNWVTVCTSHPYLFLATPGTAQVFYNESAKIYFLPVPAGSIYASCLTHLNITQLSLTAVYIVKRQTQVWVSVNVTREWEDPNGIVVLNNVLASLRV